MSVIRPLDLSEASSDRRDSVERIGEADVAGEFVRGVRREALDAIQTTAPITAMGTTRSMRMINQCQMLKLPIAFPQIAVMLRYDA